MAKQVVIKAPKHKAVKSEMDLMTLFEKFGNDEKCRMYLERLRWPDGIRCTRCGSEKISRIYKRNQFACDSCQFHFSVTAGTIFHDSHLPLMKWFAAIYLLSESKKGMSALQLKRTLKVAYKTAWYLCHRIREAVKDADGNAPLSGVVEIDETFIGGKAKNMHKRDWARKKETSTGYYVNKTAVVGAIERGGKVRMQTVKRVDYETIRAFIRGKLAEETRAVCTDDADVYETMFDPKTQHEAVRHSAGEYVFGDIHTNTLENVWSLFKRSIIGSYHKLSVKHLDRYLDEFEFRFNNRHNPFLFRDTLLKLLQTSNLEYKELTKKEAA